MTGHGELFFVAHELLRPRMFPESLVYERAETVREPAVEDRMPAVEDVCLTAPAGSHVAEGAVLKASPAPATDVKKDLGHDIARLRAFSRPARTLKRLKRPGLLLPEGPGISRPSILPARRAQTSASVKGQRTISKRP